MDAVGQNRRQLYEGVEYDHVFDIDVGEGVPALKLPFNCTENPYTAAQEFLTKYDLPQAYLDQVADFITKNARAVSEGQPATMGDPLTGTHSIKTFVASQSKSVTNAYHAPY